MFGSYEQAIRILEEMIKEERARELNKPATAYLDEKTVQRITTLYKASDKIREAMNDEMAKYFGEQ